MSNRFHDNTLPEFLKVGKEVLPLVIKRHAKAKRICLRYNPAHHAISLTLPRHTRVADGLQFLTDKSSWLIATLEEMPHKKHIKPGVVIPLLGERVRIKHEEDLDSAYLLMDDTLYIAGDRDFFPRRCTEALKKIASIRINHLAQRYARKVGRNITRISVRDTRSRWGSCSSTGNLSFSWRLVFAPREVMEYVVAHEVAHLRHMNHSPAFWHQVEALCPDYEVAKQWLRMHGKHLYRFNA